MQEKKVITLDLTGCKYLGELHERIREAFGFPEWYGANLSAFEDLIGTECDADEVVVCGVNTMPYQLIEYMSKICIILDRKAKEQEEYGRMSDDIKPFSYRIES